jgi:hypothetical protein
MIDRIIDGWLSSPLNFTREGLGFLGSVIFLSILCFAFSRQGNRGD